MLQFVIKKVNIPKKVCHVLVGEEHKFIHRAVVGICIMVIGAGVAHAGGHSGSVFLAISGDTVGFGMHGIGLIPFVEALLAMGD